jgi:transposase-like protein
MQERDGRLIPDAALEVLRERAVAMHEAGSSQLAIASALGVHKNTVHRWLKGWRVTVAPSRSRSSTTGSPRTMHRLRAAGMSRPWTASSPGSS